MLNSMKIECLPGYIEIKPIKASAGDLNMDSRDTAVDVAEIISVPTHNHSEPRVYWEIHSGDKVFVSSWGIETKEYQGEKHYFIHLDTKAVIAKIIEE